MPRQMWSCTSSCSGYSRTSCVTVSRVLANRRRFLTPWLLRASEYNMTLLEGVEYVLPRETRLVRRVYAELYLVFTGKPLGTAGSVVLPAEPHGAEL